MNSGAAVTIGPAFWVVLALLCAAAAALAALSGLRMSRGVVTASVRAIVQLTAVSLLITWVLAAWGPTAAFIAVMLVVASATSARRIGGDRSSWWAAAAIAAGAAPVLALIVVAGVVPLTTVALVPIAGILIGGAMTATSLAGRRAMEDLRVRRGEFEALLALGFPDPDAVRELCRPYAGQALHPALDQTRTVGLVTLPGAFVGVLLGGGSPVQAGAAQLLVLIGLLAAETIAIVVVLELIARGVINRPAVA
ncbi:ABC transporter permease [Catellatospora citrea]|uniref:ABC transporter permease n=1 Tax=Catellatospora citrea TaxID=53366 RepID=A0A8J3KKT6_9ACTN|nr:ABC transporter permease [Catellatospora citrea]RKE12156.1 putative ABC transport system permease protein [Catellatospora citrea]GIF98880.1 ABC transporter permease [Catellatospora citrea]